MSKSLIILVIITLNLFLSCNPRSNTDINNNEQLDTIDTLRFYFDKYLAYYQIRPENNYTTASTIFNQYYFPTTDSPSDSFDIRWFSYQLFGLEEKSLFDKRVENPTYRFLWLRTFHQPVLIKLQKEPTRVIYSAKITDGAGGYNSGKVITRIEKILADSVWIEFIKAVDTSTFFSLPAFENQTMRGCDGSVWILEYKDKNKYHLVSQWTPSYRKDKANISKPGLFLIKLLEVNIDEKNIY